MSDIEQGTLPNEASTRTKNKSTIEKILETPIYVGEKIGSETAKQFHRPTFQKAIPFVARRSQDELVDYVTKIASQTEKERENSPVDLPAISTLALLSYSTTNEKFLMAFGLLMAAVAGSAMPAWLVLLSKTLDKFSQLSGVLNLFGAGNSIQDTLKGELNSLAAGFALVGVVALVSGTLYVSIWTYTGQQQTLRIKQKCVESALYKDSSWFDMHNRNEIPTKIENAMSYIEDAICRHMVDAFSNLWTCFGCLGVALYLNDTLALIMLCAIPIIAVIVSIFGIFVRKQAKFSNQLFGEAGALASETITGIKTVASLCAEKTLLNRYKNLILLAEEHGIRSSVLSSVASGIAGFLFYSTYTIAFIYGSNQVVETDSFLCFIQNCQVTGASVMVCIYGVILSSTFFSLATPGINAVRLGRQAAAEIFDIIKHVPEINAQDEIKGHKLEKVDGQVSLKNLYFSYPLHPKKFIFRNCNLDIAAGSSIAFVGPSGSGKSTISKLLLRFYDPLYGEIEIDGQPLRLFHLKWWRDQVGYVSQEPCLFPGTVKENILAGKPDATEEEVIQAAKDACAHGFISELPQGYNTYYSGTSTQLSGGQMQRISIARAIIRQPALLLLDEATSALDTQSEQLVQVALEQIRQRKKITTITIAHRLSTIVDSDQIAVISDGKIAELGSHTQLLHLDGIYSNLCAAQGITLESTFEKSDTTSLTNGSGSKASTRAKSSGKSFIKAKVTETGEVKVEIVERKEEHMASMTRLWNFNRNELYFLILGLVGASIIGSLPPVEGIITAQIVANFYTIPKENLLAENKTLSMYFLILAFFSLFGNIAMGIGFSVCGCRLTRRMRALVFEAILRRSMGWFDFPEHSTGELTTALESDAEAVSKVTGWSLGYRIRVFASLSAGVLIAFIYNWVIGLVSVACVPLIMIPAVIQSRCDKKVENTSDVQLSAGTVLEQGLRNISSVQAYNLEQKFMGLYNTALGSISKRNLRTGAVAGLVFGFSQFAIFVSFAIIFLVGSYMLVFHGILFVSFFTSLLAVMFGAVGVAQINADFNACQDGLLAAGRLFAIIDEPLDDTDPFDEFNGDKPGSIDGAISFKSISFAYPTRPNSLIYYKNVDHDGFTLDINPRESVAFVGKSGCGKSTALQLFLRFYQPLKGSIILDNNDISELNLQWLRGMIGYVGQNPVLFKGSVKENILLGKPNATMDEIVKACKASNSHDFVSKLSEGYNTDIGIAGSLLSGGQRQRIAIARAIVQDPKILILDEATSALDNASEGIVQEAIDELQRVQPRTTLIVAHRLITVRNCSKIAVLDGGGVKELGSHKELLEKDGLYKELWKKQGAAYN